MNGRIVYTGAFRFPDGDAAAARVVGISKALRASGYVVDFAGWEERGRDVDIGKDGLYRYQGFRYFSQGDLRHQPLSPYKRLRRYLWAGSRTLEWLESQDLSDVVAIIAYHGGSVFLARLYLFCSRRNIRLITDCTEWYDPSSLVGGRFGIASIDNALRMRFVYPVIGESIIISSYLEIYYAARGCRVLRIPPLVDLADEKWQACCEETADDGVLRLVYAGIPARKDLLGSALRGLARLRSEGQKIEFHLVGPTFETLLECVGGDQGVMDLLKGVIVLHGRVAQADVPRLISVADFSILMRPSRRYAEAGFSTKLVESLAAGVPVIANASSDIGSYVKDLESGILLRDYSMEEFVLGVRRALALPRQSRQEMRTAARKVAAKYFDYNGYVNALAGFMAV